MKYSSIIYIFSEASNYTCRLCDKSGSKYVSGWISFILTQIPVDGSG